MGIKRLFDIVVSICALAILLPVLVGVGLAIIIVDPSGPILFTQVRVGRNGRLFRVYKFRTLFAHRCDASGEAQVTRGDARVFPLGHFLRRKSLDELPQLFNVLKGEMSLVGPRPHVLRQTAGGAQYSAMVPYYDHRLMVKPGLTGWAQINGLRGSTFDKRDAISRIEHDMAYIQNQSLWLDIKIVVLTVWRELIVGRAH